MMMMLSVRPENQGKPAGVTLGNSVALDAPHTGLGMGIQTQFYKNPVSNALEQENQ